jgi:two-component system, NtrC family, sensor histidine kinase KinB
MRRMGLRARFVWTAALLLSVTFASGLYSAITFSHLGRVTGETLRDSDDTTAATSRLTSSLEREDDALLLRLTDESEPARQDLLAERQSVESAFAQLSALLTTPVEQRIAADLRRDIEAYHLAGDQLAGGEAKSDAIDRYHREVNPLLRAAVERAGHIRDEHFNGTQRVALFARDESRRATRAVALLSLGALVLSVLVALRVARVVIGPLRELTESAEAIRHGDFAQRVRTDSEDELGRLAATFNRMAEDLAEFRKSNLGEVIGAKKTLEATLTALPDAVVVIDAEGGIASRNAAADQLLLDIGARRSNRIDELPLPAGTLALLRDVLLGRAAPNPTVDLAAALSFSVRGETRKLLPRILPVPGLAAGRQGAVLVLYDVTELARLDEMRSELVAVASHEFGTPLTTLRMTLLMMGEGGDGRPVRQQDLLATALVGVEQLATTVDEFLDLTRIEAGRLRLNLDRVNLDALLAETLRSIRTRYEEAKLELHAAIAQRLPTIWADGIRLKVVLSNILTNAAKYTPPGGRVSVEASWLQNAGAGQTSVVQIAVTDTGRGVPPDLRERIFDKFFRVEHHRGTEEGGVRGSGIGLYLARQVVEAHGGRILCEAGPGGTGTRIAFTLPLDRPADSGSRS